MYDSIMQWYVEVQWAIKFWFSDVLYVNDLYLKFWALFRLNYTIDPLIIIKSLIESLNY